MATFIDPTDSGLFEQLDNFSNKINPYVAPLGLVPLEVSAIEDDRDFLGYILEAQTTYLTFGQSMTAYKDHARYGKGTEPLPVIPTVPAMQLPQPALIPAKIQERFARMIQKIVNHQNYTKTIGENLGIEGAVVVFDPQQGKPIFKIILSSGGHPQLVWIKKKFQGVEIWVDRNDGKGFVKLERDFSPDYIDKFPLPAAGASAVWKYKMIYIFKDEVVGSYSEEVVVTVYGNV